MSPHPYQSHAQAPIPAALRAQFQRDGASVEAFLAAAARRGDAQPTQWETRDEMGKARDHFELGCWLHYYADRVGQPSNFQDRVDCVRRCWEAGQFDVGYGFHTVFGFNERHYDTCFEMGDGQEVAAALMVLARSEPDGRIAEGVAYHNWEEPEESTGMRP